MSTEIPTSLRVDVGSRPADAIRHLIAFSTLGDHVRIDVDGNVLAVTHHSEHNPPNVHVPYAMWGDGTKGLWLLALSLSSSAHKCSLYRVFSHLDAPNTFAACAALACLARS